MFGPDATGDQIVHMSAEAIAAWKELDEHSHTLERVSVAYRSLLNDVLREMPTELVSLFVTGTVDLGHAAELYQRRNCWHELAHAGFKLRLNDTTEAAAVVARAQAVRGEQEAAEREHQLEAHRRQQMPIGMA